MSKAMENSGTGAAGSKKEQVYDRIISSVLDGTYSPGKILSEKALAEEFSFSKAPIREALLKLCNENVLRNIPRLGYEVIRMTEEDIYDIRNLRVSMECGFLCRYGRNISQETLEELRQLLAEEQNTEGCGIDILRNWQENAKFHLTLFAAYRNLYAYHVLEDTLNRQTMAFAQFYWDKWRRRQLVVTSGFHKQTLAALERGDIPAAMELLEKDIRDFNGLWAAE